MSGRVLWTYLALSRVYTVAPMVLLAYGIGFSMGVPPMRAVAAALALGCALAGGYAYNDLRDQVRDRVNRPGRPLVSGVLSNRQVKRFIAVSFGAAVLLAAATGSLLTLVFVLLLVLCSWWYSDAIKHVAGVKNVFVGLWCGLLPWGASLDAVTAAAILPAVALVGLFITQKELVADVYDRDGDAAAGVSTIPVMMGARIALAGVTALNVLSWLVVRGAEASPLLPQLAWAAQVVATVNALALCVVFLKVTSTTVRAYLELQKVFLIGGCVGLFVKLVGS
jgi:4-hydroxybenzoate polyprenyltransferase